MSQSQQCRPASLAGFSAVVAGMLLLFAARKYTQPVFADIGGAGRWPAWLVLPLCSFCRCLATQQLLLSACRCPGAALAANQQDGHTSANKAVLMQLCLPLPHCARRQDDL